jgi:hypothetical protein
VMKVPLTGGAPTTVATANGPWDLTLDASNVYWTSFDGVLSAPKSGGAATSLVGPSPTLPTAGIAVDSTNLYWGSQSPAGVSTVPVQGGTPTVVYAETLATAPGPIAIDGASLYWADLSNAVNTGPPGGGTAETLAAGQTEVVAIAADATGVYWLVNGNANPGQGSVVKLTQ